VSAVLNGQSPRLRRIVTYLTQPDYPVPEEQQFAPNKTYLAYLDVWERLVTYIEDDSVREVALGGPDTAARARLVWQVKLLEGTAPSQPYGSPCDNFAPTNGMFLAGLRLEDRGRLRAKAKQGSQQTDPCVTPPHAQYRGVENQLYRVEIHNAGQPGSGATFK